MIAPPRNVLCSFHYFKDYDLDQLPSLRIIGDSGAFSARSQGAEITTSALAEWARKWSHRLAWCASLDVIGDPEATRENWRRMVEEEGVPGVPTIHFGADPSEMDWYAERGVDFLGLGGLVAIPLARQMRWLIRVFKYARDHHPTMRFHGWGITNDKALHLPFYSVDSSGWTSAVRFGRLTLRDPRSMSRDYPVILDGRDAYRPEVVRLLRDVYGVRVRDAATSGNGNRAIIVRIAALSTAVAEDRARRRHGAISAPAWGQLNPSSSGLHLHNATTSTPTMQDLNALHDGGGPRLHLATAVIANADPSNIERLNREAGPHLHLADATPDLAKIETMHEKVSP